MKNYSQKNEPATKLHMERLQQDIKSKNFRQMYLFCGEEDYLRNQYCNTFKKALLSEDEAAMNVSVYTGKDVNQAEVIDMAETLPFFADRRVIVLEHTGLFATSKKEGEDGADKSKNASNTLAAYIGSQPETTYFLFNEAKVDKRNALYKAVAKCGYVAVFDRQDEETLKKWIHSRVKKENMQIESRAVQRLLEKADQTGRRDSMDMNTLLTELEKCICFCLDRGAITLEDVEAIGSEQLQDRIFAMLDFAMTGQREKTLQLYYDLIGLRELPIKILALINRQLRMVYETKLLREKGYGKDVIASKLSILPFQAEKALRQASGLSKTALRALLEKGVQTDEDIKSGRLNDRIGVELLLISCCDAARDTL